MAVLGQLREMTPQVDILQFASDEWGIGERQARTYIRRAKDILRAETEQEAADEAAQIIDFRKSLIRRLYLDLKAAADSDEAVSISNAINAHLRELSRLLGIMPQDRIALRRAGLGGDAADPAAALASVLQQLADNRTGRRGDDDLDDDEDFDDDEDE
jgi:hypothetical protein